MLKMNSDDTNTTPGAAPLIKAKTKIDPKQLLVDYLRSFFQKPWSFIFFINVVCWILLGQFQINKQTICPPDSLCGNRVITDIQSSLVFTPHITGYFYFAFYILGLFTCHGYAFYANYKKETLLARLSEIVAIFYLCVLVMFTLAMLYFFVTSTSIQS
jgi:hypothetical protein